MSTRNTYEATITCIRVLIVANLHFKEKKLNPHPYIAALSITKGLTKQHLLCLRQNVDLMNIL